MKLKWLFAPLSLIIATTAFAHEDVKNPTVKARMMAMSNIGGQMKTLGGMAKGAVAFDLEQAKAALAEIEKTAKTVPALFKDNETDPKSEALPAIWSNADFTVKSDALTSAAANALASFESQDDLVPACRPWAEAAKAAILLIVSDHQNLVPPCL